MKNISVIKKGKSILNRISARIENTSYAIVGPSGAGKTTFLRLFNLMTLPASGELIFQGKNAFDYPLYEYRRQIPIVFQEPVLFDGTIKDNLILPFRLTTFKTNPPSDDLLEKTLDICRINKQMLNEKSQVLSSGEKQRIAIARALLLEPKVLLMDEPTSALDINTALQVTDNIMNAYPDAALIIVTHMTELIENIERKIVLQDGQIRTCCEKLTSGQIRQILKENA